MAIDRRAIALAAPNHGGHSTLIAIDLEESVEIDLSLPLEPIAPPRWANYPLGVAHQFIKLGHHLPQLDIAFTGDIPIGAGLSSSAAVEVATATLLEQIVGIQLGPLEKARLCQRAEHEFPGTPCGIMDMLIASAAESGHALLIDCRSNGWRSIPMPSEDEATLLIADTGVKHDLAAGEYADRRETCRQAAERLGIADLRGADTAMIEQGGLTETEHRRATHVVLENDRTLRSAEYLEQHDLPGAGRLMFDSHESLRYLYEVSCPELNTLVDEARQMRDDGRGVFGARMTGGGFGGCAIVLCLTDAVANVEKYLKNSYETAHRRPLSIFPAHASGPATALAVQD